VYRSRWSWKKYPPPHFALSLPPPWTSAYFGNTSLEGGITRCKALTKRIFFIWFPWYPVCVYTPYPVKFLLGQGQGILKAKFWQVNFHLFNGFFPIIAALNFLAVLSQMVEGLLDWPTHLFGEGRCFQIQRKKPWNNFKQEWKMREVWFHNLLPSQFPLAKWSPLISCKLACAQNP
jgi:hypothetical protein